MPTHPDGTEFETHKDLFDYVDALRAAEIEVIELAESQSVAKKIARFDEMARDLGPDEWKKTKWHIKHDNNMRI